MRSRIFLPGDESAMGAAFRAHLERLFRAGRQARFTGTTAAELETWQAETRTLLRSLLGIEREPVVAANLRRELEEETEDYRREKVLYETLPGVTVPAYLLTPRQRSGPFPAILCPPGHGGGIRQVMDEESGIYKRYPLSLVRRGFVCLVPEHLGFGERQDTERASGHAYYYLALLLLGQNAMGVLVYDLLRGLEVLAGLPEVDAARIGCWGLSLGGEMTLLLSALEPRLRAAAISGFLTSYESTFLSVQHCGCGYVPGLARYLEHADIAALIAPRPLWVEIGSEDIDFPYQATETAIEELRPVYAAAGAPFDALTYHRFPGKHEVSGEPVVEWFARVLSMSDRTA